MRNHGAGIFTYIWAIFGVNVGKYGEINPHILGPYNGAIFHIDWLVDISTSFLSLT